MSELFTSGTGITSSQPIDPNFVIKTGKVYVTIKPSGEIEYGEGYEPDAAAKAFWDAVGLERKERVSANKFFHEIKQEINNGV